MANENRRHFFISSGKSALELTDRVLLQGLPLLLQPLELGTGLVHNSSVSVVVVVPHGIFCETKCMMDGESINVSGSTDLVNWQ